MAIKTLNVHFSFRLEADEFGLFSVPPDVKAWIADQRASNIISPLCTMTVDPVTDAPGLAAVRTRKARGPNKKTAPAADAENGADARTTGNE